VVPCVVPYAGHDAVMRSVDKLELARAAEGAGLACPRTVPATEAAVAETPLPVIVKSRLHWTPGSAARVRHLLVRLCRDRAEVSCRVAEIEASGGQAVLQQPIEGELMALSAVVDREGGVVAWSQQRTLRASLRRTSARAETVSLDPGLADRVQALLAELAWFGLANVQFLRPPDGEPHLIDFNGRFYGSIALAIAAGVNLPVLTAEVALGRAPREVVVARPGVRFQGLETDLRRARVERRGGLLLDVVDTLTYAPGAAHSCLSARDPKPAAYQLAQLVRRKLQPPAAAPRDSVNA
jgi:predicted ATP-grasp superfamily ATP-dependent carboligase